jgi:glycerol-1-phosphate dehydrogenase [NAD(P)+]
MAEVVEKTVSLADDILKRDNESIKVLTEALVLAGIMMSYATTSRPASGSEHHLSHFFEINGIVNDTPYLAHGTDVAYSTIITAKIRENLLKADFSSKYLESEEEKNKNLVRLYGGVSEECKKLQEKLGTYSYDRNQIYIKKQEAIKKILKEMPTAKEIEDILARVGYSLSYFYSFYGKEKIKDAVKYAKDLKDRYTVLWLNYDINGGVILL